MFEHLDEDGQPCTQHVVNRDKLMMYATVGSRASGFHHDTASKLQSLVMSLDEISELIGDEESDVRTATETAQAAVRQLHALLNANRALTKPPQRTASHLPELLQRAAERHAVKLRGELASLVVTVAVPAVTHAFALLLDMIAGAPAGGRHVEIAARTEAGHVTLTLTGGVDPTHPNAAELIAIATYVLAGERGALRCGPHRFTIELPLANADDLGGL